jgi:hypothetical protein
VSLPLPLGSNLIAHWAGQARLGYEPMPDEGWFRRWEPHDSIAPPSRYYNSCTWTAPAGFDVAGHVVVAEPWYAGDGMDPLERSIVAFAVHSGLKYRAAMRAGEHFLTRVAFLESAPPPTVTIGDALWDTNVTTFARSQRDAEGGFHRRLRKLLAGWGFQGHLELRPGGLVVYYAGLQPTPEGYDRLLRIAKEIVAKAASYESG